MHFLLSFPLGLPGAPGTSLIYKGDPGPMGHPGSPGCKSFQGPHGSSGLPEPKGNFKCINGNSRILGLILTWRKYFDMIL